MVGGVSPAPPPEAKTETHKKTAPVVVAPQLPTQACDRTRIADKGQFKLIAAALEAPPRGGGETLGSRVARFRDKGHALEVAELPQVYDQLLDLNPAQLQELRRALIQSPIHADYGAINERGLLPNVADAKSILLILSGVASGKKVMAIDTKGLGAAIRSVEEKQGELIADRAELTAGRSLEALSPEARAKVTKLDVQIGALTRQLGELGDTKATLATVKDERSFFQKLGFAFYPSVKIGVPPYASISFDPGWEVRPDNREHTADRHYLQCNVRGRLAGVGHLGVNFEAEAKEVAQRIADKVQGKEDPDARPMKDVVNYRGFDRGLTPGGFVVADGHPVYGGRVGFCIPVIGGFTLSSNGGVVINAGWTVAGLFCAGATVYVSHPALAKLTIPIFNAAVCTADMLKSKWQQLKAKIVGPPKTAEVPA